MVGLYFSQGKVDGVAAIVGNNVILHSDVLQQSQFVAIERRVDPLKNPYLFEQIYVSTLNNIIDQKDKDFLMDPPAVLLQQTETVVVHRYVE
jgi:hypothetical protein